ncbi:TPA: hypothetical protein RNI42_000260 [Pseudomonas aeruginosa]|nr:hypothetical protein [Pseudomonas aeruginosa]
MTESKICTCPSGDGSLVHPCPAHPAVEQAGGDERAAFELFVRKHCGMPEHIAVNWDAKFTNDAWEGWQARAALAQPSPTTDSRPAEWSSYDPTWVVDFIRDNSIFNADLIERMLEYATRPAGDVPQAEQAEAERPIVSFEKYMQVMYDRDEHAKRLEAAQARVAELELGIARIAGDFLPDNSGQAELALDEMRQALHELLAAAPTQAQHSVPEEFSFEYRHPNGESHTVTVSRDQVINEMPDFLFEALCSKFCNCEPVGETNVVECCCDEYAEEFKLLAAAPGKEGV